MGSIIEKLGISEGHYVSAPKLPEGTYYTGTHNAVFIESKEMELLKSAAPEMLEVLIDDLIEDEIFYASKGETPESLIKYGKDGEDELNSFNRKKVVIEKATNKSWQEIKELL